MDNDNKLDILWKNHKGVAATASKKNAYNESITKRKSVMVSDIWGDSALIPIPATRNMGANQEKIVNPYFGVFAATLVLDPSSDGKAFVAVKNVALPVTSENRLTNFIPETYHVSYVPKIWNAQPSIPTTELQRIFPFDTGYEWEFDAVAGVLYFLNDVSPKVMSEVIYLEGYRYVGSVGDVTAVASTVPSFKEVQFTTVALDVGLSQSFTLPTGGRCVLAELRVSSPCIVECHSTASYADTNPYRFSAVAGHLIDDGSYVISGTRYFGERFITLLNLSDPTSGNTFWKVTNPSFAPAPIILTLKVLI